MQSKLGYKSSKHTCHLVLCRMKKTVIQDVTDDCRRLRLLNWKVYSHGTSGDRHWGKNLRTGCMALTTNGSDSERHTVSSKGRA